MKLIVSLLAIALCSCSTLPQLGSLATPGNVRSVLAVGGAGIMSKVTASDKAQIHKFATALVSMVASQLDSATVNSYLPQISSSSSVFVQPLITLSVVEINTAIAKFGAHNAQIVAYAQAVGNGLLDAGF